MSALGTTKGPWSVYADDGLIIVNSEGSSLGEMSAGDPFILLNEMLANAKLAAASPEMYDALMRARGSLNAFYVGMGMTDEGRTINLAYINAALSHARGEP